MKSRQNNTIACTTVKRFVTCEPDIRY